MIDEEIIANLNLEITDMVIGASFAHGVKIYKMSEVSGEKYEIFLMECDTTGQPVIEDMNVVYSTRGYFHVSNDLLRDKNKEELYNLISKKLDLAL